MSTRSTARAVGAVVLTTAATLATTTALAPSPATAAPATAAPSTAAVADPPPTLLLTDFQNGGRVLRVAATPGAVPTVVSEAPTSPWGIASFGDDIWVADTSQAMRLREGTEPLVVPRATTGGGTSHGVAVDHEGSALLSWENGTPSLQLRRADGTTTTRKQEQLYLHDVAVADDGTVYGVSPTYTSLMKVAPDGTVTSLAVTGNNGGYGVALSPDQQSVYIADGGEVLRMPVAGGTPTTVYSGSAYDVAAGPDGTLYISTGSSVRMLEPGATTSTAIASGSWFAYGVVVEAAPQAVTFTSTAPTGQDAAVGGTYTPTATGGGSGNPVRFGVTGSGACTIADGVVTFTAAGDCTVTADQSASRAFRSAPRQSQTFTVTKRTQTVGFDTAPPTSALVGGTAPVTATSSSGLPATVTAGPAEVCSLDGGTLALTGPGECTTTAGQPGDDTYAAAADVTASTTVKAAQTVSFTSTPPTDAEVGDRYSPTTTGGGSQNPVELSVEGPCRIEDGEVVLTGRGTCSITATQAGDDSHVEGSAVQTVAVGVAPSELDLTVTAQQLTAVVTAAEGAGAPTGEVTFTVDGVEIGRAPLVAGPGGRSTAGLPVTRGTVPTGAARTVRATYLPEAGTTADATWGGSTDDYLRTDPTITSTVTSSGTVNPAGWYNRPVSITYTCAAGSAPLAGPCPGSVNRRNTAADFVAVGTIAGLDGGESTVQTAVRVDARGPVLDVRRRAEGPFERHARPVLCFATDGLSGVDRACRVSYGRVVRGPQGGLRRSWTATATDRAGNLTTRTGQFIVRD